MGQFSNPVATPSRTNEVEVLPPPPPEPREDGLIYITFLFSKEIHASFVQIKHLHLTFTAFSNYFESWENTRAVCPPACLLWTDTLFVFVINQYGRSNLKVSMWLTTSNMNNFTSYRFSISMKLLHVLNSAKRALSNLFLGRKCPLYVTFKIRDYSLTWNITFA